MELLRQIVRGMVSERLWRAQLILQLFVARRGGVIRKGRRLRLGEAWLDEDTDLVDLVHRLTGVGAATFVGDSLVAVSTMGDATGYRDLVARPADDVIDQVLHSGNDCEKVHEAGGRTWVVRYAPLPDAAGQHVGMISTFTDEGNFIEEFEEFRTPLETSLALRRDEDAQRREAAGAVLSMLARMMTRLRIVALNASIISASFSDRAGLDVVAREMGGLTVEVRTLLAKVESVLLGMEGSRARPMTGRHHAVSSDADADDEDEVTGENPALPNPGSEPEDAG